MNRLLAALLASAAGATIAAAPAFAQNDTAAYRSAMDKIAADHKAAKQKCDALKDEDVCEEQADVSRARAELAAVQKHDNTPANRDSARRKLAEAEYELAEEKCDTMKGNAKDSCMNTAKSVRTAALADAKADRDARIGATGGAGATAATAGSAGLVASTDTRDTVKAAAVKECEEKGNRTACLVDNKAGPQTAMENAGDKTRDAADRAERTTERAGTRMASNLSDAAITAKVKAGLAAARDTSALAIKVETEKGVVMLSGFVESKAEAERAEKVAKDVDGVANVKSTLKVK